MGNHGILSLSAFEKSPSACITSSNVIKCTCFSIGVLCPQTESEVQNGNIKHNGELCDSRRERGESLYLGAVVMVPPTRKRNWKFVGSVKTSAKDMIGFGKRFHAPRPTEEWMKELREGEEE